MARRWLTVCVALAVAGGARAVPHSSMQRSTVDIDDGDNPSTTIETTVTQDPLSGIVYSARIAQSDGWQTVITPMSAVGDWFLVFQGAGGESANLARVRLFAGGDSLEFIADQVLRLYCPADSTDRITAVRFFNPHPDSMLSVHVVATGQ